MNQSMKYIIKRAKLNTQRNMMTEMVVTTGN